MTSTLGRSQPRSVDLLPPTLQTIPEAIGKNIAIARARTRSRIVAVVKADGYGVSNNWMFGTSTIASEGYRSSFAGDRHQNPRPAIVWLVKLADEDLFARTSCCWWCSAGRSQERTGPRSVTLPLDLTITPIFFSSCAPARIARKTGTATAVGTAKSGP